MTVTPIVTKDHKQLVLSQLKEIKQRADRGVHTHSDYAQLVRIITKVVKTLEVQG